MTAARSPSEYNRPHQFQLCASRQLLAGRLFLACMVIVWLVIAPIQPWAAGLGVVLVLGFGWYAWCLYQHWQPITLHFSGRAWALEVAGNRETLVLAERQFVTSRLVILYFKTEAAGRRNLILPVDGLPSGEHRKLRKLLVQQFALSGR